MEPQRPQNSPTREGPSQVRDLPVYDALNALLRHRRLLIGLPLVVAVGAVLLSLLMGTSWTARSVFSPESSERRAIPFSGLAAQFGIELPGAGTESIDFYARLLTSDQLLRETVTSELVVEEDGQPVRTTLLDLWAIEGETHAERLREGVDALRGRVGTGTDNRADVVTLRTTAASPELAVAINSRMLELVREFNQAKRRSKAAEERQFVEASMKAAQEELETAENALEAFLTRNRRIETPDLRFEQQRLQRRVDVKQQVYTSLAQAFEQARIDEVHRQPVITVVDPPEGTARRDGNVVITALVGLLVGLVLALALVLTRHYLARLRVEHPEQHAEFVRLARGVPLLGRWGAGRANGAGERPRDPDAPAPETARRAGR